MSVQENNFFVEKSNSLVFQAVSTFNPRYQPQTFLIYGSQGAGKTTFLNILEETLSGQALDYLLVDGADFARRYAYAAHKKRLSAFRQRFRSTSILILDNLDVLAGKKKSTEEFFYTCETIWLNGGHVIMTVNADLPSLNVFGPHLSSRLRAGFSLHIKRPTTEEVALFLANYRQQPERWPTDPAWDLGEAQRFFDQWHFGQIIRFLEDLKHRQGQELPRILGSLEEIGAHMMALSQTYYSVGEDKLRGPARDRLTVHLRSMQYFILEAQGYNQRQIADYFRQQQASVTRGCTRVKKGWQDYEKDCLFFWKKLAYSE